MTKVKIEISYKFSPGYQTKTQVECCIEFANRDVSLIGDSVSKAAKKLAAKMKLLSLRRMGVKIIFSETDSVIMKNRKIQTISYALQAQEQKLFLKYLNFSLRKY